MSRADLALFRGGGGQVIEVRTQEEVPYRMAVHPRGDGVLCAFPNGCRYAPSSAPRIISFWVPLYPALRLLLSLANVYWLVLNSDLHKWL